MSCSYFDYDFHSEDAGEDVVKVVEDSVSRRLRFEGVLGSEHGAADEDAGKDDVTKVGVVTDPPAEHAELVGGGEDEERGDVRHGGLLVGDVDLRHATRSSCGSRHRLIILIDLLLVN